MTSDTDMDDTACSLAEVFGRSARARVLDTLISMPHPDMNITDIADQSEMARSTIYREFEQLQSMGIIEETRVVGGSPMYTIDESALKAAFHRALQTGNETEKE